MKRIPLGLSIIAEAPRRAIYHSNRAAAYLARATGLVEGKYRSGTDTHGHLGGRDVDGTPESIALQLRAAVMDCDSAIEFDSKLCKAWMRKAQAHARLGEVAEAERAYDRAMEVAGPGARGKVARDKAKWLRSARCATGTKDSDADGSLEEGPTQVRKVRKAGGQGRGHDSGQRGEDERENGPSDEGMARAGLPRGRGALSQAEDAGAGNTTTGRNASDMMAMLLGGASGDGGREDAGSGGGGVGMKVVQTRRVGGGWFDKSDLDEMD